MARFEREARLLASLNHPNIAAIYGLEESGPIRALVMELVEGPTLADRIRNGPIPVDEALPIAKQIAEAVEYAHENNVIHRDLKPANIKLKVDGTVKVLDFGLAKAMSDDFAEVDMANSPTLSLAATQQGFILGTAGYMAPEQAKGKTVDRRADVWAFGVISYEMLTGKQPFEGETIADTLAHVITKEVSVDALPASTPSAIRTLLRRCLEKNAKRRLAHIGEARILLEDVVSGVAAHEVSVSTAAPPAPIKSRAWMVWVATTAAMTIVALGTSLIAYRATRPVEHPLMRFADDLSGDPYVGGSYGPALAISPDGSRLAYVSRDANNIHISTRLLASDKTLVLAGTEGGEAPFFSPDGRWIGFFTNTELKKISVEGGAAVTICSTDGPPRGGGFWSDDGTIYFARQQSPVLRVSANGGTPSPATQLDKEKEVSNRGAQVLPGGDAFLFEAAKNNNIWEDATIQVQSIKSGQRKTLVQGGYFGRYIHGTDPAQGHLIYLHGGTLFAAPMDIKRLELIGPAQPVLEGVAGRNSNGLVHLALSNSGTLVYLSGSSSGIQQSLSWMDVAGNTQALPASPSTAYVYPRISPDGSRIAVFAQDGSNINLVSYEPAQNRMTRLTFFQLLAVEPPVWTPDGKHIVFHLLSSELSGPGLYWTRSDGAGMPQPLMTGLGQSLNLHPYSFSPDGRRLAYAQQSGTDGGIWTLPLDLTDPEHPKPGKPELFLSSKSGFADPAFSPDGRWIAYTSTLTPQDPRQVFVRPFPGPGGVWQVSNNGGQKPTWSRDGRTLYYQGGSDSADIMLTPYSVRGDSFEAGQPRRWSEKVVEYPNGGFDLTADGKRAAVVTPASGANPADSQTHVMFLLNFADELRHKVPPDN
jgi:serine/threonine-protein kinase